MSILKERKKLKTILKKNNFLQKSTGSYGIFLRTKCHLKKFLVIRVNELLIYNLNLTPFVSIYSIFTCVDPCPYSEYGSGSTKLLNTDPGPDPVPGSGSTTLLQTIGTTPEHFSSQQDL